MAYERVEVITSVERRRRWSAQEKLRLVAESYRAEGGVGVVADRAGLHRSLLQRWRRQVRDGTLVADRLGAPGFVPLAIDDGAAVSTPALGISGGRAAARRGTRAGRDRPAERLLHPSRAGHSGGRPAPESFRFA